MHRVCIILLLFLSAAAHSRETELKIYRPFKEYDGQKALITAIKTGDCSGPSKLLPREDAWQCQIEDKNYDPCFASFGSQKKVLCPQSPWDEKSLEINLRKPINNKILHPIDMSQDFPWGMELENGTHCLHVESEEKYDNLEIGYQCDDDSFLLGHIQRCDPLWRMLQKKGAVVDTVKITKAWF